MCGCAKLYATPSYLLIQLGPPKNNFSHLPLCIVFRYTDLKVQGLKDKFCECFGFF